MGDQAELHKRAAGEKAADYIKSGMVLGLGSGSTVYWMLKKLGKMVEEGLDVKGIPSSVRTEGWAKEFNIPLTDFSETLHLDLAIDGADEIDPQFRLTKGGGGSLVREKIVDAQADKLIIIADQSKLVEQLGKFPLPVEVIPFGWQLVAEKISQLGAEPILRERDGSAFISNNGNYILDCAFGVIKDPKQLDGRLKSLIGVVETGLFIGLADLIIISGPHGVEVKEK